MVRVAVVGAGALGTKIAGELAFHGHEVRIHDSSLSTLDGVQHRLAEDRRTLREDGLLNQPTFVGEVFCLTRLEETVKAADFIIEAISEDINTKQDTIEPPRWNDSVAVTVRQFLERMGKTGYFRSGPEPLVLTEEERDTRRQAFAQYLKTNRGHLKKMLLKIPDLSLSESLLLTSESEESQVIPAKDRDCVVCMDDERNCVLHPCHHLCTCAPCGRMLLKRQDACPICRKHIVNIFRIFHS